MTGQNKKVFILIRGMGLKADSIAFDTAFQYKSLMQLGFAVECYAEEFDSAIHPDLKIKSIKKINWKQIEQEQILLIYHWCDGWHEIEAKLLTTSCPLVVRWHNNTPPWFFGPYSVLSCQNTARGYLSLLHFLEKRYFLIWTNSFFSKEQLIRLGVNASLVKVVYPCSRYIEADFFLDKPLQPLKNNEPLHILFVSRIVPHKGHRHIIEISNVLQNTLHHPVKISFPGRPDPDMPSYSEELKALAQQYQLEVHFLSEVSQDMLTQCYKEAHIFICCSEHEGFGLPIIEAMRFSLPVCAYAITALKEIMHDHPLAIHTLNYAEIAKQILAILQSKEQLQRIIKLQNELILPKYAKKEIVQQIHEAYITSIQISPANLLRLNQTPTDFAQNWVTWYDLATCTALLQENEFKYPIGIKKAAGLLCTALARRINHHIKIVPGMKKLQTKFSKKADIPFSFFDSRRKK